MTPRVFIGPAGWSYKDWEGIVYPPEVVRRRGQLAFLADTFNLLEINNSFYRIPSPRSAARWAETVSARPDFRFTIKLFQGFTHERGLDPSQLAAFREMLAPFREAGVLGCVLIQFPWSFRCDRSEKIHLRRLLDAFADYPLAVEVRHGSWDVPAFYGYLRDRGVAFCNIDQPLIGDSLGLTARVTAPRAYLRLHGRNRAAWFAPDSGVAERYNYLYSEAEVEALAGTAEALAAEAGEVYVVANNHYRGKAVLNALQLSRRLIPGYTASLQLTADAVR
jgi:uncharacterized protein YecE (DUF72 family)